MKFSTAVQQLDSQKISRTENGMKAWESTDSKVVDLFSKIGSARNTDLSVLFRHALSENEELAVRTLLWARDIRGGAGERNTFRKLLAVLEKHNPYLAGKIMSKIPIVGRWDDLFTYTDSTNVSKALNFYADALFSGNGLAAKWAPREKSAKKAQAAMLRSAMGFSPRDYRKFLAYSTDVVENKMCSREWDAIDFSKVPSLASARYQKAFGRNASVTYSKYLQELSKPETERSADVKINAGAVYPYDVLKSLRNGNEVAANAMFDALPNFVGDAKILPMVDVSESMETIVAPNVTAMDVAVSLGLYLSAKGNSDFKDMFVTFTSDATIQRVSGTLKNRIYQMKGAKGYNTNLVSAFDSILQLAVRFDIKPKNMPDMLLILSDMQFDNTCIHGTDASALEMIRHKYDYAGYKMPKIIFWNLAGSTTNTPVKIADKNVALVSGFSPSIMTSILSANIDKYNPYNIMLETLNNPRYDY